MKWNQEVPIKWEAAPWIPAYCVAHWLIGTAIKETFKPSPQMTTDILFILGGVLAVAFLIHAKRIKRRPGYKAIEYFEPEYYHSSLSLFNDTDDKGSVLFRRMKPPRTGPTHTKGRP